MAPKVYLRIDDRLIHGQVIVGWVPVLNIKRLVVVNDEIAARKAQQDLMRLCVPEGLGVEFCTIARGAELALSCPAEEPALFLFSDPESVLRFFQAGYPPAPVNIGGMHYAQGKRQIRGMLCVDDKDIQVFRELLRMGVFLELQAVPGEPRVVLEKVLPEILVQEA